MTEPSEPVAPTADQVNVSELIRVTFRIVGRGEFLRRIGYVAAKPAVGEAVDLGDETYVVKEVAHYPIMEDGNSGDGPLLYVVVGRGPGLL